MEDLKNLDLEKMNKELVEKFNHLLDKSETEKELHKELIKISAKYPELKEIVKFIIFINDIQNTHNKKLSEAVFDELSNLLSSKKIIIEAFENHEKKYHNNLIKKSIQSFSLKDLKIISISVLGIIVLTTILFFPDKVGVVKDLMETIKDIIKG
jgi:hypothetical protein